MTHRHVKATHDGSFAPPGGDGFTHAHAVYGVNQAY
jgi:hypothetical protein